MTCPGVFRGLLFALTLFFCYPLFMTIKQRISGMVGTNSYYVTYNDKGYLIDAPDGIGKWIRELKTEGYSLDYILLTHGHFDHVMGLEEVLSIFPDAEVYIAAEDENLVQEGNKEILSSFGIPLSLYSIPSPFVYHDYSSSIGPFKVIKTPGHTKGGVCLYREEENILFSGDTLFEDGEGRTDLGGDWRELVQSLKNLALLPENTTVFPGHGGKTDIKREKMRLGF